jgi:hypothetical protein
VALPHGTRQVSRRLERYARTKDPAALWPGLREAARVAGAQPGDAADKIGLSASAVYGFENTGEEAS